MSVAALIFLSCLFNLYVAISNGFTPGITLPSIAGQEAVIQKAYAVAGLPTDDTIYIEVHIPRVRPISFTY